MSTLLTLPWTIPPSRGAYRDRPNECPECAGAPTVGHGQCATCGAMLVAEDPKPGEFLTTTLIPFDRSTGRLVPRRRRRSIRIQDGYRRQADGSLARVFRVIDRANGRYRETVQRDGVTVRQVDEPLSEHRGHGSAKYGARTDPRDRDA